MKKVLWNLPYGMVGGVETLYATILKFYKYPGHKHYLSCANGIKRWADTKYRGLAEVHGFESPEDLALIIRQVDPDVIMGTHGMVLYNALRSLPKFYKVIEVVHGSHIWVEHNIHMPKDWTQHIVCVSKSAMKMYLKHAKVDLPASIIINGVDTERFYPRKTLGKQANIFAYFGRFLECDKHITKLVQAFRVVGKKEARLFLIGGTPQEVVHMKHYVKSQRMYNVVKFFGHTDEPERFHREIDISVVRSEAEGYCNSAAEALACGTPLVCYNFGGILDHVPPDTILVANTQAEFAKCLKQIHRDYNLRNTLRHNGLRFIREAGNADIMAKSYQKLIERVISSPAIKATPRHVIQPVTKSMPFLDKVSIIHKHPVVGVCNPHWHGIHTATKGCTDRVVPWNKDPNVIVKNVLEHKPRAVVFSGYCPGFDQAAKKLNQSVPCYSYYHGGMSHYSFFRGLFGQAEYDAFQKILTLHQQGIFRKIAVSSPGLDAVGRARGIKMEFCGNILTQNRINSNIKKLSGVHIGNWNRPFEHKHTSIGTAAAQLVKDSTVHILKHPFKTPLVDYSRVQEHSEMSQEEMYAWYQRMSVCLQLSFIETFNISVLEMWACGVPVVLGPGNFVLATHDLMAHGVFICDHTNPKEVANAIQNCLNNPRGIVEKQYEELDRLNKESKQRWEAFFEEN